MIETRAATVQASASAVHFADEMLAKPQAEVQIQTVLNCHMTLSHERWPSWRPCGITISTSPSMP